MHAAAKSNQENRMKVICNSKHSLKYFFFLNSQATIIDILNPDDNFKAKPEAFKR